MPFTVNYDSAMGELGLGVYVTLTRPFEMRDVPVSHWHGQDHVNYRIYRRVPQEPHTEEFGYIAMTVDGQRRLWPVRFVRWQRASPQGHQDQALFKITGVPR